MRGEWFDDPDGTQTGFARTTYWELTPTVSYALTDHVTVRAEYRHDEASGAVFPQRGTSGVNGGGTPVNGQDLIRSEFIVAF